MAVTLGQLAERVGGILHGDGGTVIHGAATLQEAQAGEITLVDKADKAPLLQSTAAHAAIAPQGTPMGGLPLVLVDDVHKAFAALINFFRPQRVAPRVGVSPAAHVAASAKLGDNVDIHPGATVGEEVEIGAGSTLYPGVHIMAGCKLGRDVTLLPNCVLYENTTLGDRVLLHAGVVLGAYGFGYKFVAGRHVLSAQLGNVVIEDDVEIGANSTVDRGTYGATVIGAGTKVDNLVMIAHNCRLGKHNMICSQVGIAGSTTTGDYVVMAGQVGVRDHVHIGAGAVLGAMSGITNNVPAGVQMMGIPATPERDQKLKQAALAKLPEMRKQLKALARTVEQLQLEKPPAGQGGASAAA